MMGGGLACGPSFSTGSLLQLQWKVQTDPSVVGLGKVPLLARESGGLRGQGLESAAMVVLLGCHSSGSLRKVSGCGGREEPAPLFAVPEVAGVVQGGEGQCVGVEVPSAAFVQPFLLPLSGSVLFASVAGL